MAQFQKHFLRAWIQGHLYNAIRKKAFEDNTSMSAAVNSILSNYFVYHQKYLAPLKNKEPSVLYRQEDEFYNDDSGYYQEGEISEEEEE